MNDSEWSLQDYLYVTAECVTGVLSVTGNTLVLLAIWKTAALQTVTNCFLGSLAVADVLVGVFIPPNVILSYRGLPDNFYGCIVLNSAVIILTDISILNLLAVALERYLAIKDPFLYQRLLSIRKALGVVVSLWIIALLMGSIPTMGWHESKQSFSTCAFTSVIDLKYMVYMSFFVVTLIPLFSMLVIYLYIFKIVHKQRRQIAVQTMVLTAEERKFEKQQHRDVRGAKKLAYVILLFVVCWLPLSILNCFTVFAPDKPFPYQLLLAAIVLSHANSFMNPFLYAFSNSKFKAAMVHILRCGHIRQTTRFEKSKSNN